MCVCVLVAHLCLTLWDPMDCRLPGSSVHGISPGKNTGVCCYFFPQRIFPNQRLNPGLLYCRQTLPSEPWGFLRKLCYCAFVRISTCLYFKIFFSKAFFFFLNGDHLKSLLNLLQYCLCFMSWYFLVLNLWAPSSHTRI